MKIGGLDPSLNNFGMVKGTLDIEANTFDLEDLLLQLGKSDQTAKSKKVVRKNSDDLERARKLYKGMTTFLADVDIICVEIPVGSQTARAMTSYGICIGLLASLDKPLIQVTPSEVKIAACGNKQASKSEMIDWATNLYPEANWIRNKLKGEMVLGKSNEHLADALAAIKAGVMSETFQQILAFRK